MDLVSGVVNTPLPTRTHPHAYLPFVRWIANAAACLTGPHGAVTEQAQEAGCSRQCAYDHAEKVLAAVEAEHSGGPTREE